MTRDEIRDIRKGLNLTQEQFAQLLGVHGLTVSKWERGLLEPTPYQESLIASFKKAVAESPDIGKEIATALVGAGIGFALFLLLKSVFGKK